MRVAPPPAPKHGPASAEVVDALLVDPVEDPLAEQVEQQEQALDDLRHDTEPHLVRLARTGDEQAFAEIVRRHGPAVHRFSRRMVGNDPDAHEVVQETFIAAWRGLDRWSGDAGLRAWLLGIARRRAVDLFRRRRPEPVVEEVLERSTTALPDLAVQGVLDDELVEALQQALHELGELPRAVWLLREIEGLSYEEVAQSLGVTTGAVRGQLHRARKALAERMERWR